MSRPPVPTVSLRRVDGTMRCVDCRSSVNRWRRCRALGIWCVLMLLCAGQGGMAAEGLELSSARYFQGLRERGLFRLAISYCEHRLGQPRLSARERADLTLELSRTLAEQARNLPAAERTAAWDRARQVIAEQIGQVDGGRRLLLDVQQGLLDVDIGEFCRWQLHVADWDAALRARGIESLTAAGETLARVEQQLAERRKGAGALQDLSAGQQRSLLVHVREKRGLSLVELSEVSPVDSAERAARLIEALRILRPLADARDDDEIAWRTRHLIVRATRLQGDLSEARRLIELLRKRDPSSLDTARLLLEESRCLQSEDQLDAAARLLTRVDDWDVLGLRGEMSLLAAEILAREWRLMRAQQPKLADAAWKKLESRVLADMASVNREWQERLAALLDRAREERMLGPELARLSLEAQAEYQAGRFDEAVRLFGLAAAQAAGAGLADRAFQLGMKRSSIEIDRQQWRFAADDLKQLVTTYPDDPRASQADLLAAYALGRQWQATRLPADHHAYQQALEGHTTQFATSATAAEAHWLLAELLAFDKQWGAALAEYRQVPLDHPRGIAARRGIARSAVNELERNDLPAEQRTAATREIVGELSSYLPPTRDELSAESLEVALALARILLRQQSPDYEFADRLLARVFAGLEVEALAAQEEARNDGVKYVERPGAADQRVDAMQLRVISLAGQQQFHAARKLLEGVSESSPAELLAILDGVAGLVADEQSDPLHALADLQLKAAQTLDARRDSLAAADQRRLDLALARALRASSKNSEAIAVYARVAARFPRDPAILLEQGRFLVSRSDADDRRAGLVALRRLESLHSAGSDEWLAARLEVARGLLAVGQSAEALKLVRKTRLLYPKLGHPALAREYSELQKLCGEAAVR